MPKRCNTSKLRAVSRPWMRWRFGRYRLIEVIGEGGWEARMSYVIAAPQMLAAADVADAATSEDPDKQ
jgi:hypothetical protein